MIIVSLLLALVTLGGYYIYRLCTKNGDYFKGRGFAHLKPKFLWGNTYEMYGLKLNMFEAIQKLYLSHPTERCFGMFAMRSPVLLIRDPDLIKHLAIKEFDKLMNHGAVISEDMDSLMGNTLVSLSGQKWRDMRSSLSPIFTGSKMRQMFELISDVCHQMVADLDSAELEMKDFCGRFTNDIIALCAFGLQVNSIKEKDNKFYKLGQDAMDFKSPKKMAKFMGFKVWPRLMKLLKLEFLEDSLKNVFRGIVMDTIEYRTQSQSHRPDMINLIMEIKKQAAADPSKPQWTDEQLVAQCFIFFLAGFDTTATALSFACYELAINQDVQQRLLEEVQAVQGELNGQPLSYETLQGMKYMDAVVSEVLRMRPPAGFTDRVCSKAFNCDDGKGFRFQFAEGDTIWIPIYGLHMDEKYFSNPQKFDPERWLGENREQINNDAYMPFGLGQRSCIANRFALMVLKGFLYYFLASLSIGVVEKTQIPLKIKPSSAIETEKGVWVGVKRRAGDDNSF